METGVLIDSWQSCGAVMLTGRVATDPLVAGTLGANGGMKTSQLESLGRQEDSVLRAECEQVQRSVVHQPTPLHHRRTFWLKVCGFGGAGEIESVPNELEIAQRGQSPDHYEIAPKQPMTLERYRDLLNQGRLKPPTP